MLVLSRRLHQTIIIGDPAAPEGAIEVTVLGTDEDEVHLGVRALRPVRRVGAHRPPGSAR